MKKRTVGALFVAGALVLGTGCSSGGDGPESERAAVDAYVEALNSRDADAMADLVTPGNEAGDEIATLIKGHGGLGLKVAKADIRHEFGPDFASADVVARGKGGKEYKAKLTLDREGGSWYVALGEAPGGASPKPTSA
ncbi:hypothetical protein LG634_24235 [Streptomyces bambusae]|uniref:hypothetical protein n=1 Tax=Streptomyces bambusae TaxID=1550616 RepID=UPI001CFCFD99|nr:hypothetical protein [Streptomyces bambusae]MCB5167924.1 hypothetical protein [Streptomyces bambusae]